MSTYHPDRWFIVRISRKDSGACYYKLMSSWYGGYSGSDSWKLSSVLTGEAQFDGTCYILYGSSGSKKYMCHTKSYGSSSYTRGVFLNMQKELQDSNEQSHIALSLDELSEEEAISLIKGFYK